MLKIAFSKEKNYHLEILKPKFSTFFFWLSFLSEPNWRSDSGLHLEFESFQEFLIWKHGLLLDFKLESWRGSHNGHRHSHQQVEFEIQMGKAGSTIRIEASIKKRQINKQRHFGLKLANDLKCSWTVSNGSFSKWVRSEISKISLTFDDPKDTEGTDLATQTAVRLVWSAKKLLLSRQLNLLILVFWIKTIWENLFLESFTWTR